jgi:cytochrome c oxidase subunit 3
LASSSSTDLLAPGHVGRGGDGGLTGRGWSGDGAPGPAGMPERVYVTGMAVAVCGIVILFSAQLSASIVRRGLGATDWRPLEIPSVLWLNTAILLASSFCLERARRLGSAKDEAGFRHWWSVTTILGLMFVAGQLIAWRQMAAGGLYLTAGPSVSFFYVFTAAHGLHLLGGIAALLFVGFGSIARSVGSLRRGTATLVVSIYWHFLSILWVFLLLFFVWERYS